MTNYCTESLFVSDRRIRKNLLSRAIKSKKQWNQWNLIKRVFNNHVLPNLANYAACIQPQGKRLTQFRSLPLTAKKEQFCVYVCFGRLLFFWHQNIEFWHFLEIVCNNKHLCLSIREISIGEICDTLTSKCVHNISHVTFKNTRLPQRVTSTQET